MTWMGNCSFFKFAQMEDGTVKLLVNLLIHEIANEFVELILEEYQIEESSCNLSKSKFLLFVFLYFIRF